MDRSKCEESEQNVLDFKCKKILHGEGKSAADVQHLGIASQTPEKINEPLYAKFGERGVKHLEKYNNIVEVFDSMTCSLRLLRLCKRSPTFTNISTQVEILTKRKFSFRHLAQIKYILPEAIQIDSILVHNKKTLCMEPDLKITLLLDIIEGHCQQSDFVALRQVFDSRLVNFFMVHPQACDIPEATLPEPLSQRSQASLEEKADEFPEALGSAGRRSQAFAVEQSPAESIESLPNSDETELFSTSTLLNPSFSPHFSRKNVDAEAENTISLSAVLSDNLNNQADEKGQSQESPSDIVNNKDDKGKQQIELLDTCSRSTIVNLPVQPISPSHACESPFQKLSLPTDSLMIETPAQITPKRSMPSCDNKLKAMTIQNCTSSYKPAKRSLNFSHLEGERSELDCIGMRTDSYNVFNDDITQDVEVGLNEEGNDNGSSALLEKVEGNLGSLNDDRKEISVCLPDLVASIHHIFKTVNCSAITKQELVHKIIMNNLDIIERREVEEQIELLEKLVPEWIYKKLAPSGDIMYNIKKFSDLASIQAKVISA